MQDRDKIEKETEEMEEKRYLDNDLFNTYVEDTEMDAIREETNEVTKDKSDIEEDSNYNEGNIEDIEKESNYNEMDIDKKDEIEDNFNSNEDNIKDIENENLEINNQEIEDALTINEEHITESELEDEVSDIDASIYKKEEIDEYVEDNNQNENKSKSKFIFIIIGIVIFIVILLLLLKGCKKDVKYTIKFDTNGGNNITEQVVEKDSKVKNPSEPTKEGYKFIGWYVDDKEFDFNSKINKDTTIKAKWEKIENIRVTGITLDQTEVTIKVGASLKLSANVTPEDATEKKY